MTLQNWYNLSRVILTHGIQKEEEVWILFQKRHLDIDFDFVLFCVVLGWEIMEKAFINNERSAWIDIHGVTGKIYIYVFFVD